MKEENDFVTVAVAAKLLGKSTFWLKRCAESIGLPEHRTGGQHRRYRLTDVKEAARRLAAEKLQEAAKLQEVWL